MLKNRYKTKFNAIDLFAGCGGLTLGMKNAGFATKVAVEINSHAADAYALNHPETRILQRNIKDVTTKQIREILDGEELHLLAGCPPCQGFSSIRRLNRELPIDDERNRLVEEFFRFVEKLKPKTFMMENVPSVANYPIFKKLLCKMKDEGYFIAIEALNVREFGVPQNRKRLIVVGSLLGKIEITNPKLPKTTVRDAIFDLELPETSDDYFHKIIPKHSERILDRIKLTPKDGGSWRELPEDYFLECHKKDNVGFNDVYGRLKWDDCSSTITGGCLNPSKGRFLHPEQDRVLTPREAALLQSFPRDYKFPINISKQELALLIGNALPPRFSFYHSSNISCHLKDNLKQ